MSSNHKSLPNEIILHILSFASPLDVLSARAVSRQFRDITYDHELWKNLYKSAPLPHLPGPYPSQSTQFLEHALVQSARLARTWTTEPLKVASRTKIPSVDSCRWNTSPKMVCGRWVLSCELRRKIVLYDMENRDGRGAHHRQVIWKTPGQPKKKALFPLFRKKNGQLFSWKACSVTSIEGEFVYVLVGEAMENDVERWDLLEFRVDESGQPIFFNSFNVPTSETTGYVEMTCSSTLLYMSSIAILFDTTTRIFYKFPKFTSKLGAIDTIPGYPFEPVILTKTHILRFGSKYRPGLRFDSNLFQAFTLPANPIPLSDRTCTLCLTHEGCMGNTFVENLSLIRDSIIDPLTGSTSIRLLWGTPKKHHYETFCVDLALPRFSSGAVLPMSMDTHCAFTVDIREVGTPFFRNHFMAHMFVQASDEGYARGWCKISEASDHKYYSVKFTIDATNDKCVSTVSKLVQMEAWINEFCYAQTSIQFDGVQGKICYQQYKDGYSGNLPIVVLNVK